MIGEDIPGFRIRYMSISASAGIAAAVVAQTLGASSAVGTMLLGFVMTVVWIRLQLHNSKFREWIEARSRESKPKA
jgi:hypothetical protein